MYNEDMNFDRVMAMITLMFHLEELRKYEYIETTIHDVKPIHQSDFFNRKLFIK